jgi:hypothetical protein
MARIPSPASGFIVGDFQTLFPEPVFLPWDGTKEDTKEEPMKRLRLTVNYSLSKKERETHRQRAVSLLQLQKPEGASRFSLNRNYWLGGHHCRRHAPRCQPSRGH